MTMVLLGLGYCWLVVVTPRVPAAFNPVSHCAASLPEPVRVHGRRDTCTRPHGSDGHQVPACGGHLQAVDVRGPPRDTRGNADRAGAPGIPGASDLGSAGAGADDQPARL